MYFSSPSRSSLNQICAAIKDSMPHLMGHGSQFCVFGHALLSCGRRVAVKWLCDRMKSDEHYRTELETLASIKRKNIVALLR